MLMKKTLSSCSICGTIPEYIEIENAQDEAKNNCFPPEVGRLVIPHEGLGRFYHYSENHLLKCPECAAFFWYECWRPGGSDDVFRTYIHESIKPVGAFAVYRELLSILMRAKPEFEPDVRAELLLVEERFTEIVDEALTEIESMQKESRELEKIEKKEGLVGKFAYIEERKVREKKTTVECTQCIAHFMPRWNDKVPEKVRTRILKLFKKEKNSEVREALEKLSRQAFLP
jgi:hypothetical protein